MTLLSVAPIEGEVRYLPPMALPGLQILVVEDDDADAYLIETALAEYAQCGQILRATDGVEALEMIEFGATPDLAIIDLHMPRKNGFSLLVDLLCLKSTFPMIVLTSSTAPSDAVRSRLRGADRFLAKPDTVEELRRVLTTAINALCVS
jgi:CheY-like chemotaxis protein